MLNRQRCLAFITAVLFFAASNSVVLSQDLNDILGQHDPTNDATAGEAKVPVPPLERVIAPATATATPAADEAYVKARLALLDKLLAIFERLVRIYGVMVNIATKPSTPAKPATPPKPSTPAKPDKPADNGSDPVAAKVGQVAAGFPGKYNGYQKFPYAAGTEGGNLGCANVVSAALKQAGVNAWSLNCDGVKSALLKLKAPANWKVTNAPPYQAGDVVIWKAPPGGRHKHIGIVVKNGNSFGAMNNSSSKRKPIVSVPVNYRAVECVIRKV